MRLRFARPVVPIAAATVSEDGGLAAVPLRELRAELKRRGFSVLPTRTYERLKRSTPAGEIPEGMVDGSELCRELGGQVQALSEGVLRLEEWTCELRERAHAAEDEVERLVRAFVHDEFPETTYETEEPDG